MTVGRAFLYATALAALAVAAVAVVLRAAVAADVINGRAHQRIRQDNAFYAAINAEHARRAPRSAP